jgi:hypothetical protein
MISNTTKNTKFCTDCKYKSFAISTCKYPEFATITKNNDYLVNGQENTTRYPYCSDMRNDENKCGKEAKYFKQITKEDINELFENEDLTTNWADFSMSKNSRGMRNKKKELCYAN